jgi:hypothetical protein
MTPEPLKRKLTQIPSLIPGDIYAEPLNVFMKYELKSAVEGLIKFHEDRIEKYKKELKSELQSKNYWKVRIKQEEESIMAIEHWLEDVI